MLFFKIQKSAINEFEIHHLEWPINEIELKKADLRLPKIWQTN